MEEAEDKSTLVGHWVETHNRSTSTGGESTHLSRCRGNRRTPGGFLEEMVLEQNSSTRVNQVEGGVWEER